MIKFLLLILFLSVGGTVWHFYDKERSEYLAFAEDFETLEARSISLIRRVPSSDMKKVAVAIIKDKQEVVEEKPPVEVGEELSPEERLESLLSSFSNIHQFDIHQLRSMVLDLDRLEISDPQKLSTFMELLSTFDEEHSSIKMLIYQNILDCSRRLELDLNQVVEDLVNSEENLEFREVLRAKLSQELIELNETH